ncbi:hypothetical protein RCIX1682 [Methanocella arvoryzae MRE50]|uniref:Uncharacterized protein n=1 Tax=Methanocella arvoryzae (strain DSM 22066 / NBRC 105507 / MRE50) TaxID=351160 RepID=Q0W3Y8_METAR|nr:hypothetical protein RCIX1682 [Methanocella arvoryzae MRE50]
MEVFPHPVTGPRAIYGYGARVTIFTGAVGWTEVGKACPDPCDNEKIAIAMTQMAMTAMIAPAISSLFCIISQTRGVPPR